MLQEQLTSARRLHCGEPVSLLSVMPKKKPHPAVAQNANTIENNNRCVIAR